MAPGNHPLCSMLGLEVRDAGWNGPSGSLTLTQESCQGIVNDRRQLQLWCAAPSAPHTALLGYWNQHWLLKLGLPTPSTTGASTVQGEKTCPLSGDSHCVRQSLVFQLAGKTEALITAIC